VVAQLPDDRRHGVRAEVRPAVLTEPVDGLDQPDGADLDEIVERLGGPGEATGERMDERQVLFDDARPGAPIASPVVGGQECGGRSAPRTSGSAPPIGHADESPLSEAEHIADQRSCPCQSKKNMYENTVRNA
jgi:hypothetical protein